LSAYIAYERDRWRDEKNVIVSKSKEKKGMKIRMK
jgi:hypothetical protein